MRFWGACFWPLALQTVNRPPQGRAGLTTRHHQSWCFILVEPISPAPGKSKSAHQLPISTRQREIARTRPRELATTRTSEMARCRYGDLARCCTEMLCVAAMSLGGDVAWSLGSELAFSRETAARSSCKLSPECLVASPFLVLGVPRKVAALDIYEQLEVVLARTRSSENGPGCFLGNGTEARENASTRHRVFARTRASENARTRDGERLGRQVVEG